MRRSIHFRAAAALLLMAATPAVAGPPSTWEGLVLADTKHVAALYLLPNADFRAYSKVLREASPINASGQRIP